MKRWFFGLIGVGDQAAHQVHQEIDRTAMARMLDLGDVLELVGNCLNNGTFA